MVLMWVVLAWYDGTGELGEDRREKTLVAGTRSERQMANNAPVTRRAAMLAVATILLSLSQALARSHAPPALSGVDALGRRLPPSGEVRAFRADRYVGIFYVLSAPTTRIDHEFVP